MRQASSVSPSVSVPPPPLNREQRRVLLRIMLESRLGDLREESLNRQGKGHFHVSGRGHEALAVIGMQLQASDFLLPYYRDRGLCLGRGMTSGELALEYFGKRSGVSRGRMMPSHYCCRSLNIVTVPTPTAAQLLPACGVAWGMQLEGRDSITVTSVGDAATRQGDFFESVSFALERKLPLLLIVEDNAYGISTPTRKTNPLAIAALDRARWTEVDGSDAEVIHTEAARAIAAVRCGEGPVFLWVRVERLSSHTSSDDHTLYRSRKEILAMDERDPIRVLKERMIAAGELTLEDFKKMEAEIKEQVRGDYAVAERAPNPGPADLFEEISGAAPDLEEELFKPGRYRMGDLLNKTLRAGLDVEPARMIFGEDVEDPKGGVFRLTQGLSTDFPQQVFNSPLAESTIIGVGGGLALYGRRPVFEVQFIDFIYPGFNQLISNLATIRWRTNGTWRVPAVFYAAYGAYLPGGGLWHSQANESVFAHFPGINVVVPSNAADAAGLLWTAMHAEDVTLFLIPKHMLWAEQDCAAPVRSIPFGSARVCTEGDDLTLVAWGNSVEKAMEAVAELNGEAGVDLIDLRTIVPWDREAIERSVRKTGRLLVVQEDGENCSVGQMIISHLMGLPEIWSAMKAPPQLVSKGNVMIGYNPIYEYAALPDVRGIVDAIWRLVSIDSSQNGVHGQFAESIAPWPARPFEGSESGERTPAVSEVPADRGSGARTPEPDHGPRNTVIAGTHDIVVRVPIMGEGLRSARVVHLARQPGDPVAHDDVLCEVETDKAVYPIESSFSGTLKEWKVKVDDIVSIGQEIAIVTGDEASIAGLPVEHPGTKPPPRAAVRSATPAPTATEKPRRPPAIPPSAATPPEPMKGNARQPALHPAITKRLDAVVPANMLMDCVWEPLRRAREALKAKSGKKAPSPSAMIAWCVTKTMERHAAFRCTVAKDGSIYEQPVFDLGIAVALDGDRLATAVVPKASSLTWSDFVTAYNQAVDDTRAGVVIEVNAPVNLTSLGAFGVESATPIVVPPSMATLFVGTAHERMVNDGGVIHPVEVATLSLTFDHRVVNGAGAAAFLQDLKRNLETFAIPA